MQFEFRFGPAEPRQSSGDWLKVGARRIQLQIVRHRRARRYVLRLARDGAARVTIPRGGSIAQAKQFVNRNTAWLEKQLLRHAVRPLGPKPWSIGTEILFRGELVRLQTGERPGHVLIGSETVRVPDTAAELRPVVERHLWRLAARELPRRVAELAALHQFAVRRITVRNQRSRWGSCSPRAAISLNWRLIQAPPFVRDYIILHELAHLKEMNHSRRFWREVARLCPQFREAERWLKGHRDLLP